MDLDLSKTPKQVYKKAFDIAENCGYMVEVIKATKNRSAHILVLGEDVSDGFQIESVLNFKDEKFNIIQKVLYRISYEGLGREQRQVKKMLKVFDYLGGEFVEIFDQEKHDIQLKGDVQYQQALSRENRKDHPLYTGNGVEKRSCTCISEDECPYYTSDHKSFQFTVLAKY